MGMSVKQQEATYSSLNIDLAHSSTQSATGAVTVTQLIEAIKAL